jgi:hypothetical protein
MNLKNFLAYLFIPLYRPNRNLTRLIADRHRVGYAVLALLLIGVLYTIIVYIGSTRGFGAVTPSVLNIAPEDYYRWETFFGLPVYFIIAIVFAGTARLIAHGLRGTGSYESLFAIYGVTSVLPMVILLWIPEAILMVLLPDQRTQPLGGATFLPLWLDAARQILSFVWPLIITWLGIKSAEQLGGWRSAIVTVGAFIPTAILILVFIR